MKKGPIHIRSLAVRPEGDGEARIVAVLENRSRSSVPPFRLMLYFYDGEDRVRDRLYVRLRKFEPGETQNAQLVFRLKSTEFFRYEARLEKLEGTDYSNFEKTFEPELFIPSE